MSMSAAHMIDDIEEAARFPRYSPRPKTPPQRGEDNPSAKLTAADVVAIRSEFDEGRKVAAIARRYDISPAHVYRIGRGLKWGHVK